MNKKKIYQLLASVSLLGAVSSQTVLTPQAVYANDFTAQKGTFTVGNSVLNVRSNPSTSAEVVASYQPSQEINYDQIGTANGYRWISYVGSSGDRRYVAIGTADGLQSFGSLSNSGGSSSTTTTKTNGDTLLTDTSYMAGTWVNGKGNKFVINADGTAHFPDVNQTDSRYDAWRFFERNGQLTTGPTDSEGNLILLASPTIPFSFAKAGEDFGVPGDVSDNSRDRLVMAQSVSVFQDADSFYYRVGETSTATKESSSDATKESVEEKDNNSSKGMDTASLLKGDFSSVAGEWQMEAGDKLVIDKDGYLGTEKSEEEKLGNVSKAKETSSDQDDEVLLATRGGKTGEAPLVMDYFYFYPAGTSIRMGSQIISSDESKDRIVVGAKEASYQNPYYLLKADEAKEASAAETKENTSDRDDSENKTVAAKPWTGDNPYLSFLKEATYFENTNDREPVTLDYALYDIDGNGTPELLVGRKGEGWLQAVYTLVDNKLTKVTELGIVGGVAGAGGYRGSIGIYEKGQIVLSEWGSGTGEGERYIYRLKSDNSNLAEAEKEELSMRNGDKPGLIGETLIDVKTLDWKTFGEEEAKTDTSSSDKENKTATSSSTAKSESSSTSSETKTETSSSSNTRTPKSIQSSQPKGNVAQRIYKTITNRKTLPSTGEAVSVLGLIGAGLLAIAFFLKKKLSDKKEK